MSDLDPLLGGTSLDDPNVTRLMVRHRGLGRAGRMLDAAASVATSVSAVITESGDDGDAHVEEVTNWRPNGVRVEMLVVEDPTDAARLHLRDALGRSGRTWRVLDRPLGGRACAIAAAIEQSEHEFVIVSSGGGGPFELVASALSYMWVDGADVALLQWESDPSAASIASADAMDRAPDGTDPLTVGALDSLHAADAGTPEMTSLDVTALERAAVFEAAGALAEWLGLAGVAIPGRLVVMRRWVARWLFNEIARAIDPAEEIADRARLLGIGIVQMVEPMPPGIARTTA